MPQPPTNAYRFHIPDLTQQMPQNNGLITLPEDEAHHARAVLRLEPGNPIILFDGKGSWVLATLQHVSKRDVLARISDAVITEEKPPIHLTLCTAVPKGDRADQLIEQASQLNVSTIEWLSTERGVVKPRDDGKKMDKWRRLAIESAKQCGRAHLMEIMEPVTIQAKLRDLLADPIAADASTLWLEPRDGGKTVAEAIGAAGGLKNGTVTALIGPEGGWSDNELALLNQAVKENRLTRVRLTPTILRIETACAAVAAIVMGSS